MQKSVGAGANVNKRGLHAFMDIFDPAFIYVAQHPLGLGALHEQIDQGAVLRGGDPGFVFVGIDDDLFLYICV